MNIKYIILCRYNSRRLPGKILKQINGKPLLEILLERLAPLGKENLVIATSIEPSDDIIESYCRENDYTIFRGSLQNVSERFLACATAFEADYVVRINGDNLFADPKLVKDLVNIAVNKKMHFVSNVPNRTYPTGMSVEVVKVDFYKTVFSFFNEDKYKEHVTLYLYDYLENIQNYEFIENNEVTLSGMHLAIDNFADFEMASYIIQELGERYKEANWKEIVKIKKRYDQFI